MAAMSAPFKLYRLQQIDSQIDRARSRLHEIDIALGDDAAVRRALQQKAAAQQAVEEASRAVARAEAEVLSQRLKIEQTEASLYGGKVRNPKELQDLEHEAAALKRYLTVLEDRQLDAMLALEDAEGIAAQAAAALDALNLQTASQNEALLSEQAGMVKDVQRQEQERQAVAASISPEEIQLYEQLRSQRKGVAVARVTDRACSACGSTLSAALLSASRSPNQITRCATCGRILYHG
jgi:predicted  nucleic acid-binding Zn-ribbon protein